MEVPEQVFQQGSVRVRPLCRLLSVVPGGYSGGLQRAVVDFGAEDSFALAAERLGRHHPVKLCANTVRKITLHHAEKIQEQQRADGVLGALASSGAEQLIAQADGTMLPVVEFSSNNEETDRRKCRTTRWAEMRLCAVRDAKRINPVYGCDADSVESLGYCWSHCAGQAGWALNSHIHVISDGAAWIARQAQTCFGAQATHLLDLFHLMEYLAQAQKAHPPWAQPKRRWLRTQKRRLLKGQYKKVLSELKAKREPAEITDEDAPIRVAHRYINNHANQLEYHQAIAKNLPVGSGMIEAGHRHVLQKRLKKSGAWWAPKNLNAMAQLRVCRANHNWSQYWKEAA